MSHPDDFFNYLCRSVCPLPDDLRKQAEEYVMGTERLEDDLMSDVESDE
jgi:hypothetical protein